MAETMVALGLIGVLVLAPLWWRVWRDKSEGRALSMRAEIQAAVNRALKGESFLSVRVTPATPWRVGRVLLSTPTGSEWLIEAVWDSVLKRVPGGYELVVRPGRPKPAGSAILRRAA